MRGWKSNDWRRQFFALVAAGVVAGTVGAAGGVTTLVSYPALLAVGVPPLPASIVNLVAGVACWPGSALSSRRELAGAQGSLRRGLPIAAAGSAVGAVLLLITPPGAFTRIVPFLVVMGSLALLLSTWLSTMIARSGETAGAAVWPVIGLVSIYGGYFGAASGIMLLAALLILHERRLPEANAIKNMLLGAGTVVAAAIFVLLGPVDRSAVVPLALGLFAGSAVGPIITRSVPWGVVRWVVGLLGLTLAITLWVRPP